MARPYRLQGKGLLYHVTSRGDNRKRIFISNYDFEKFLGYIVLAKDKYKFYLYAYCLMDNHYHLLLETTQPNLSKILQYINTAYTIYYNRKRNKCGHLFQGRYKSIIVEADTYFKELTRYIHLNPVRAKMVDMPQEYRWSSYDYYIENKANDIVDISEVKQILDMDIKQYSLFVKAAIDKPDNFMRNTYRGFLLGSKGFIKEQLKELAVQAADKDFAYKRPLLTQQVNCDDIINVVAKYFKQDPEKVRRNNNRPATSKKMAIYLIRKKTALTNNEIGEIFNMKFSAVSKAAIDFKRQMEKDKKLLKLVDRLVSKVEV